MLASSCAAAPTATTSSDPLASASARVTPSPSSMPTPAHREAEVIARVLLPHPYAQTAMSGETAVTDEAIFIASYSDGLSYLTRIDVASARVSDVALDSLAGLDTDNGAVWILTPWGALQTNPPSVSLGRVDVLTGEPRFVTEVASASGFAFGLGGVWVADGELRLLDAESGAVIRVLPWSAMGVAVACGELWSWDSSSDEQNPGWLLDRLDPLTGEVVEEFALPDRIESGLVEIEGTCWTRANSDLYGIAPGGGGDLVVTRSVGTTQFAGPTVWSTTERGVIQRLDPTTGDAMGDAWQLPLEDLHLDPKGQGDWRLLSAGGSLWLLGGDRIVCYAIPTSP